MRREFFKCWECNSEFDRPDTVRDYRDTVADGVHIYEYMSACPYCRSFEVTFECEELDEDEEEEE